MKRFGAITFPEKHTECDGWEPYVTSRPLHSKVLAVAKSQIQFCWKAYIRDVPGLCHEDEIDLVIEDGATLPVEIAKVLFPQFKGIPYAR